MSTDYFPKQHQSVGPLIVKNKYILCDLRTEYFYFHGSTALVGTSLLFYKFRDHIQIHHTR